MYWLRVLNHFEQKRYIYNGLTLPFLIGSSEILHSTIPVLSIPDILHEIYHSEIPLTVMQCGNIGEYVFGIMDGETVSYNNINIIYRNYGNLFVTDSSFQDCISFDDVIQICIDKYSELIENKQYSKINGDWQYFSEKEIKGLKEIDI